MKSLASSVSIARFPETCPVLNSPSSSSSPFFPSSSIKLLNKRTGSLKFAEKPCFPSLRIKALACEVSGGDGEDHKPLNNGFSFVSDGTLSFSQVVIYMPSCLCLCMYLCYASDMNIISVLFLNLQRFLYVLLRKFNDKSGKVRFFFFNIMLDNLKFDTLFPFP